MNISRRIRVCAAAVLAAVSTPLIAAQAPVVSGTISYRERIALAPTATVTVRLDDVTRAGAVPPVIAETEIDAPGQVPIRFELPYDASRIDQRGRYAVRASIRDRGVLLFTSLDTPLVLTQGHGPTANLILTRVGTAPPPEPVPPQAAPLPPNPLTNLPATFTGRLPCADCSGIRYHLNLFADDSFFLQRTYDGKSGDPIDDLGSWTLSSDRRLLVLKVRGEVQYFAVASSTTLRQLDTDLQPIPSRLPSTLARASMYRPLSVALPMKGMYTYFADAGSFVECSTGQRWPVATEGANADLERAYSAARPEAGLGVLAEIDGHLSLRPRTEGQGQTTTLVVDRVGELSASDSCDPRFAGAPLTDTEWRLTQVAGRAVPAATDPRRAPALQFQPPADSAPGSYSGSTGCNRIVGTYETQNAAMTLTAAGTMMACQEQAGVEAAMLAALKATKRYRIAGHVLELMDADGARLARFDAQLPTGITVR